jgi:GGDEF domain-containing protein
MSRQEGTEDQVFRERFADSWEHHWRRELRGTLSTAAQALATLLDVVPGRFGVLPAVYFPRLRMGSVMVQSWGASEADSTLALPWNPDYIPPPFTCFAPPIAEDDEQDAGLITRVASFVDRLLDPEAASVPRLAPTPLGMYVGAVTWVAGKHRIDGVVDADFLVAAKIRQTSATYALPLGDGPPLYVPMLYVQSADTYDGTMFEQLVEEAARSGGASARVRPLYDALVAVARAARLRASEWLHPKTHLLSQAGFEGLKDDLQRRVAAGELYAECFFDIDEFKAKNDAFGYVGADLIAAELVDRVLFAVQQSVADEYAAFRAQQRVPFGKPNGFRALIAHVSGDEFKFFARSNLIESAQTEIEVSRARSACELVVHASARTLPTSIFDHIRFERTFPAFSTTRLFQNAQIVANVPATVSIGFAVVSPSASWPISYDDFDLHHYPIDEQLLRRARKALDQLDGLAERALFGAKRVPAKTLLSTELLERGGRLSVPAEGDPRLLLGWMDGVLEGDEFDVFTTPTRQGEHPAILRVEKSYRRTALVRITKRTVKPRREDYYVRLRQLGLSPQHRHVTALLRKDGD